MGMLQGITVDGLNQITLEDWQSYCGHEENENKNTGGRMNACVENILEYS
jgi:hypothetical protein